MRCTITGATVLAVAILASLAHGGDAPADGQTADGAVALRKQVEMWEDVSTGKTDGAGFDHWAFRALLQRAGAARVRGATPDLLHLLNNVSHSESTTAEYVIGALGEIRDERAIVPLMGEVRWSSGDARSGTALNALLAFRAPVCPQIVLALQSDEEIHVRRGLWALRILAQGMVDERLRVKLSKEERPWFAVSEEACAGVARLFSHKSLAVRFEAGVTWTMVRPLGMATLKRALGTDESPSIRLLIDKPDELIDPRTLGGLRDRWAASLLGKTKTDGPHPDAYRHVSRWVPLGKNQSLRVSLTHVALDFHEPVYDLNEPVWVRMEVRNDGAVPLTLDADHASGQPCIYAALHDSAGRIEVMGTPKVIRDTLHPAPTLVLQANSVHTWEFEFLHDTRLLHDGEYTIHPMAESTPVMLTLKVTGLPQPLWEPGNRAFGYNTKTICYHRFNVPSGPADVYREPATLPPPTGSIYAATPIATMDGAGNQHVYYEPGPHAFVPHKPADRKPIDPKFLAYVQAYHEVVTNARGRLIKWLRYEKGALVESISYDEQERLRLHIGYDRHGEPGGGTSVEYTATGKIRRRAHHDGADLRVVDSVEFGYDDQDRRVKEERYDASGKMTDYFRLFPDKRQDTKVWYERFSADGTPQGKGWMGVD